MSEENQNVATKPAGKALTASPGSLALWAIEVLDFLYYSGEGFDDMEFLDRFMERAEDLKILGRAKAVPDSEYEWYWLRNYLENGEVDRRRLAAEGDIENAEDDGRESKGA